MCELFERVMAAVTEPLDPLRASVKAARSPTRIAVVPLRSYTLVPASIFDGSATPRWIYRESQCYRRRRRRRVRVTF